VLAGAHVLLQDACQLNQRCFVGCRRHLPQLGGHEAVEHPKVARQAATHGSHLQWAGGSTVGNREGSMVQA
jgi:hypothetical protein